jgi:hypothetical protein
MNEDIEKLQRMLEQATAAEEASEDGLDPETASLREAWIGFGRLLDAAEASAVVSPLALASLKGTVPVRPCCRLLPTAALLAASLLMGIVTAWMFQTPQRLVAPSGSPEQMATVDTGSLTPTEEPQWDDAFDEQMAQIDQQIVYVQQDADLLANASGSVQYQLEQMQQELESGGL